MIDSSTTFYVFFGAMVLSQIIGRRAQNKLSPEQKVALLDSSPKVPWILIFIIGVYALGSWTTRQGNHSATFFGVFSLIISGALLVSYVLMIRRFQKLQLPSSFIGTIIFSQSILFLALLLLFWGSYTDLQKLPVTP